MQQCTAPPARHGSQIPRLTNSDADAEGPLAQPQHDKDKEAKKKKQQPNGTKNNNSNGRLPFIAAAVIGRDCRRRGLLAQRRRRNAVAATTIGRVRTAEKNRRRIDRGLRAATNYR